MKLLRLFLFILVISVPAYANTYKGLHEKAVSTEEMKSENWQALRHKRADEVCTRLENKPSVAIKFKTNRPHSLKDGDLTHIDFVKVLNNWLKKHRPRDFYITEVSCGDPPPGHKVQINAAAVCGLGKNGSTNVLGSNSEDCLNSSMQVVGKVEAEVANARTSGSPPKNDDLGAQNKKPGAAASLKKLDLGRIDLKVAAELAPEQKPEPIINDKEKQKVEFTSLTDPYSTGSRTLSEPWTPEKARAQFKYQYKDPGDVEFKKEELGFFIPDEEAKLENDVKRMDLALRTKETGNKNVYEKVGSGSQSEVYKVKGENYVLKVKKRHPMGKKVDPYKLFDRDAGMLVLLKENAKNFSVQENGKTKYPIQVVGYDLNKDLLKQGIVKQEMVEGLTAFDISETFQAAKKGDQAALKKLKAENFDSVDEADLALSWLESFYREGHPRAMRFQEKYGFEPVANQVVLYTQLTLPVGFDGNKGYNAIWDKKLKVWRLIDW